MVKSEFSFNRGGIPTADALALTMVFSDSCFD
jgi:hypothetical protein